MDQGVKRLEFESQTKREKNLASEAPKWRTNRIPKQEISPFIRHFSSQVKKSLLIVRLLVKIPQRASVG